MALIEAREMCRLLRQGLMPFQAGYALEQEGAPADRIVALETRAASAYGDDCIFSPHGS
jgi:hypothetical protein